MIEKAVIDTGPLFDALVFHHGMAPLTRSERVRSHNSRSGLTALQLLQLMASIRVKLTTSHGIGEINRHVTCRLALAEPELSRFWNSSIDLLLKWNLDETLIRLLDFARESGREIARVGIVDTGLVRLAQRHGCILITDNEKTLARLAWEQGVQCRLTKHLSRQTE